MSQSVVLTGANCKIFIGGKLFPELQSITYTIDYGEQETYGIDSIYAQEIAVTRLSVQGSCSGVRLKLSGGLQGKDAITKINQRLFAPYVSLEIRDRQSDTKLLFVPQCKITTQNVQIGAKGVVKLNFNFKGIIPYEPLDMN
jgi:hypothetical protein